MKQYTLVLDYGVGNLYSVVKALRYHNASIKVSEDANDVHHAQRLIIPGVGSFGAGMQGLSVRGLIKPLQEYIASDRPVLGICLGAQLLMARGHEFGEHEGLHSIRGSVEHFPSLPMQAKIPHVGWNTLLEPYAHAWESTILSGLPANAAFYFVHSYILNPTDAADVCALSRYGDYEFCSVVRRGNMYGCQFHPEKSGNAGLQVIKNFLTLSL